MDLKGESHELVKNPMGLLFSIIGVILLAISFYNANDFLTSGITIDDAVGMKLILFFFMVAIGVFISDKGTVLIGKSNAVSIVFLVTGVGMQYYILYIANIFAISVTDMVNFEASFVMISVVFLIVMVAVGAYLVGKGILLSHVSGIFGYAVGIPGLLALLYTFYLTDVAVNLNVLEGPVLLGAVVYIPFMLVIGSILTTQGVAQIRHAMTGYVLSSVGVILLIYTFLETYTIVVEHYSFNPEQLFRIIFLIYMAIVGVFLATKGVAEILRTRGENPPDAPASESPAEEATE